MVNQLNTNAFAALLDRSPRQAREIFAKLESLGFVVSKGLMGDRKIPEALAVAVRKTRDADKPLKSLVSDPSLTAYRSKDEADPLQVLIQARADLSILRQGIAPIVGVLEQLSPNTVFSWGERGLPDPESEQF
jgi:hypothetical protein